MWDCLCSPLPWHAVCPLCHSCLSLPLLPVWMYVSLTLWLLDFHANDFLAILCVFCFLIGCYPSFGCVRKQRVSAYASILVRTLPLLVANFNGHTSVLSDTTSQQHLTQLTISFSFFYFLFMFRQRGREGEKPQCVVASPIPLWVTWPAAQTCTLTRNSNGDVLVHRLALGPLTHTSQTYFLFLEHYLSLVSMV